MNRLEFMKQLELLLGDISQSEREEALQYYSDYLNDAGVENEQEVMEALGTPEQLAKVIKEGLKEDDSAGEFTENGYYNEKYEMPPMHEVVEKNHYKKGNRKQMSTGMIILIVILCIVASPVLIGIVSGIFGAGIGIIGGIFGLFVGIIGAGIGLFSAGIALIGVGIGEMVAVPLAGMCLIGVGILFLGLALFFIWLAVWLCGTAIPWVIRTIVNLVSRLFHRRGGAKA
jgi:uncharacterized membrane protein